MNAFIGGFIVVLIFLGVYAVTALVMIAQYVVEISYDLKMMRINKEEEINHLGKPNKDLLVAYVAASIGAIAICVLAHLAGLL